MRLRRRQALASIIVLLFVSCSDRKENNPLTENNEPPQLQLVGFAADTLVFVSGQVYPFEFQATDDGERELDVLAKVVGETGSVAIVDNTSGGLYKGEFTPSLKGEHLIEVSASDGLEETTETLSIFMGDNHDPVAVITLQEIDRDAENLLFTYEFDASQSTDQDGALVKARWNLDGFETEGAIAQKIQHTFDYYADYRIELVVEDEHGGTGEALRVIDNSRPLASFEIRPAAEARNSEQITLDASNSVSPRGQLVAYRWFNRVPGVGIDILEESADNIFRYTVNLPVGQNQLGLVVEDEESNVSDTSWVALDVLNTPPEVDYNFATELERIIITENLSVDGDPGDSLSYSWFINDTLQTEQENEALPTFQVRGEVYQLTLQTSDNHGSSGSRSRSVSVPGVPEAHFVFSASNADTLDAQNGQQVVVDGNDSIPGNESGGIETFTWFLRGENHPLEVLSEGRFADLTIDINHPIGEYEVGLEITNREGLISITTWQKMSVVNSAPTAEFTCQLDAFEQGFVYRIITNDSSDPDPGDSIRFKWFLDGEEQEQTGPTPSFTRGRNEFVETITLQVLDNHGGIGEKSVTDGCSGSSVGTDF